jgi:hypothetical protein
MNALPVLMLTQDATLWQEWQQIAGPQWMPARGQSLADLQRWKQQGRTVVVLDAALPSLPESTAARWIELLKDLQVLVLSNRPSDEEGGTCCRAEHRATPMRNRARRCCRGCCKAWLAAHLAWAFSAAALVARCGRPPA